MDDRFAALRIPVTVNWAAVGTDLVVLELTAGQYYGLNELGARVFLGIQQGVALSDIHRAVAAEFDVETDVLSDDIRMLVDALLHHKLLEIPGPLPT